MPEENDETVARHDRDIAVLQGDIRWIKWLSGAAAASSTANIIFGAQPTKAAVIAAVVFVGGILVDAITHFPR